jgi:hypothetical protein
MKHTNLIKHTGLDFFKELIKKNNVQVYFIGKDLEFVGRSYGKKLEAIDLKTNKCHIFPKICSEKKNHYFLAFLMDC